MYFGGVSIYTSLSSLCMFKAKEEVSDKGIKFSNSLKTYFKKGSPKNNPVIVQLKLKNDL